MGATWNGNVVPDITDFWSLTDDFRKMAENNNRIIPVSSAAERDALTGPGGGAVPDGTAVLRLDRSGVLDVRINNGWLEGDGGWVSMDYFSGYTAGTPGQLAYKVAGNTLHIKGGAEGNFPANNYIQVSPTLIPPEFRPDDTVYMGSVGTAGQPAGIQISNQGYIQLVSSTGPAWISAATSLPLN